MSRDELICKIRDTQEVLNHMTTSLYRIQQAKQVLTSSYSDETGRLESHIAVTKNYIINGMMSLVASMQRDLEKLRD